MEAPPERLAYVAVVNPKKNGRPTHWASWMSNARPPVTETWSASWICQTLAMSSTTSAGTRAVPACVPTLLIRTWSGVT